MVNKGERCTGIALMGKVLMRILWMLLALNISADATFWEQHRPCSATWKDAFTLFGKACSRAVNYIPSVPSQAGQLSEMSEMCRCVRFYLQLRQGGCMRAVSWWNLCCNVKYPPTTICPPPTLTLACSCSEHPDIILTICPQVSSLTSG